MELAGRVAVVTGGGSGIGRAMAEAFARERAMLVVADLVVDAIRVNRLYVITHEEGLEALRRRHERLEQAILQPKA